MGLRRSHIALRLLAQLALLAACRACTCEPATDARAPAGGTGQPTEAEVRVVEVSGSVERRAAGAEWAQISAGQALAADDEVRTQADAQAVLSIDALSRVTITPSTEVRVTEVTDVVRELKVNAGRISVDHNAAGGRVLRVRDATGQAVAESRGGRFSVAQNGNAFAVATQQGKVSLTAAGQTVSVDEGRQAAAYSGRPPQAPKAIPTELLLKVARSQGATDAETCAVVRGLATPGAQVFVAGESVPVAESGEFEARVAAKPGMRTVELAVRDATGREKLSTVPCDKKAARPSRDSEIRGLRIKWGGGEQRSKRK